MPPKKSHTAGTQETESHSNAEAVSMTSMDPHRAVTVTQSKTQGAGKGAKATPLQAKSSTRSSPGIVQKKENHTGLPDQLKTGIESMSGYSMDDVRVHYNSDKPAQLNAHAYAQGSDIHIASGQEQHLAHEAWHVVQQKQGRVRPTLQMKEKIAVNDDPGLEHEADQMGRDAMRFQPHHEPKATQLKHQTAWSSATVQRAVSGATMNLWDREHNQEIALESGDVNTAKKTVKFNSGDITITISEHASNHFVNRHTIKEFSFKDENIKEVNSFWEEGTRQSHVNDHAVNVIKALEDEIEEGINEGKGVLTGKGSKGGVNVGYLITLQADEDSYELTNEDTGEGHYEKGTGNMTMFYPEGGGYEYYKTDELQEIRTKLQGIPYSKVLQLKKQDDPGQPLIHMPVQRYQAPVAQRMSIEAAGEDLKDIVKGTVFENFSAALTDLNLIGDIPQYLVNKLKDPHMPEYYLPSSKDIWKAFITKILKYKDNPLTEDNLQEIDLGEKAVSHEVATYRQGVLDTVGEADEATNSEGLDRGAQNRYEVLKPLAQKILQADLTCNFALDTLFKYTSPHMLNAFEIKEKLNINVQNIEGGLEQERLDKEAELFEIAVEKAAVFRPRYAAINFHKHEFGAAARNDYGLSHMVMNDALKDVATFTCGDTFNTDRAYRFNADGVEALLRVLAKDSSMFEENKKLLVDGIYKPNDTYFDTQIHQDLDIRKDVKEIIISTAEMRLFNIKLPLVERLISRLTGGIFVRVG